MPSFQPEDLDRATVQYLCSLDDEGFQAFKGFAAQIAEDNLRMGTDVPLVMAALAVSAHARFARAGGPVRRMSTDVPEVAIGDLHRPTIRNLYDWDEWHVDVFLDLLRSEKRSHGGVLRPRRRWQLHFIVSSLTAAPMDGHFCTAAEAGKILKVNKKTLYRWVEDGTHEDLLRPYVTDPTMLFFKAQVERARTDIRKRMNR